ncbi:MAG TPA: hypothetical protein VKP11_02915, partial [Frankiaceae bacterium]|nr:hypothetical protein [Frankiaceae bacterium]
LAVAAGVEPRLGPLATAYVLLLAVVGPVAARAAEPLTRLAVPRLRRRRPPRSGAGPVALPSCDDRRVDTPAPPKTRVR